MRHVENLIMIQKIYIFIIKNNQPFSIYLQKDEDCYLTFHIKTLVLLKWFKYCVLKIIIEIMMFLVNKSVILLFPALFCIHSFTNQQTCDIIQVQVKLKGFAESRIFQMLSEQQNDYN